MRRSAVVVASVVGFAVFAFLGAAGPLAASGLRVQTDRTRMGIEDTLQLTVVLEGRDFDGVAVRLPDLVNLTPIAGPWTSTVDSLVNGVYTHTRTYNWVLRAGEVGEARIGSLRWEGAGTSGRSSDIVVEVVPGSLGAVRSGRARTESFFESPFDRFLEQQRRMQPARGDEVFVATEFDRAEAFVGEQLVARFVLYADPDVDVTGVALESPPSYAGFWSEEIPSKGDRVPAETVMRGGRPMRRFVVGSRALFPLRAGRLGVKSAAFNVGVREGLRYPFERMFAAGSRNLRLSTDAATLRVKPMPPGAPPSFGGAVGRFELRGTCSPAATTLGGAVVYRLTVEGRGAVRGIDVAPRLLVPGADVHPPAAAARQEVRGSVVHGRKTWEYVVVPRRAGRLQLPEVQWTYFDPLRAAYVTATAPALEVAVAPAHGRPGEQLAAGTEPQLHGLRPPSPGWRHPAVLEIAGIAVLLVAPWLLAVRRRGRAAATEGDAAASPSAGWRSHSKELRASEVEDVVREEMRTRWGIANHVPVSHWAGLLGERGVARADAEALARFVAEVQAIKHAPQLASYEDALADLPERARTLLARLVPAGRTRRAR